MDILTLIFIGFTILYMLNFKRRERVAERAAARGVCMDNHPAGKGR